MRLGNLGPNKEGQSPKPINIPRNRPTSKINAPIAIPISSSSVIRNNLVNHLEDVGFQIEGPVQSVEEASNSFIRSKASLLIYDYGGNSTELGAFIELIDTVAKDSKFLIISNNRFNDPNLNKLNEYRLKIPIKPEELSKKIEALGLLDFSSKEFQTTEFTNNLFATIISLTPVNSKITVENQLKNLIEEFCDLQGDFMISESHRFKLFLKSPDSLNSLTYTKYMTYLLKQLIEKINDNGKNTWAEGMVHDAIEKLVLNTEKLPQTVSIVLNDLGINTALIQTSINGVVQKLSEGEKSAFVATMHLGDLGPELTSVVTNDEEIVIGLDDAIASQIITLVGQGSSYHEGIYGPIPIPTSNNICAMIWSKMLKSDIIDVRLQGKTLGVVAIGFYNSLMPHIPARDEIQEIFEILAEHENYSEITQENLFELMKSFTSKL